MIVRRNLMLPQAQLTAPHPKIQLSKCSRLR